MMVDLSDIDVFPAPDGPRPGAPGPKPHRHDWETIRHPVTGDMVTFCRRCGDERDPVLSRRGRNNRSRGNAIERDIAKSLGLRRVGQFGGAEDISGEMFVAQVKSGGAFSERFWGWLKALPRNAGQTPLLVVTDAPGPGHKRRAVVILDLEDWRELHAGEPE